MRQRKLGTKIAAWMMCLAMVVTTVNMPAFTTNVKANDVDGEAVTEPALEPTDVAFIGSTQMESNPFNLEMNNKKNCKAVKINYGTRTEQVLDEETRSVNEIIVPQTWYIAGWTTDSKKQKSLILVCDPEKPMATDQQFNSLHKNVSYNGVEVYGNHYGASNIRDYLTKEEGGALEHFTAAEKSYMVDTEIYTEDMKNGGAYLLTDKLYAPCGNYDNPNMYVGNNSLADIYSGIPVTVSTRYWPYGKGGYFWLRSPGTSHDKAAEAVQDLSVRDDYLDAQRAIVPAFHMDMSDVIFASSATPATLEPTLDEGMTFRMDGTRDIISSVSAIADEIIVGNPTENEYLYVQWMTKEYMADYIGGPVTLKVNHVKSFQPTAEKSVFTSEDGIPKDLSNCRIWIEKKDYDENIVYAKEAHFFVDGVCKFCGICLSLYQDGVHNFASPCDINCDDCGEIREASGNHTFEDGTCTACNICQSLVEKGNHVFVMKDGASLCEDCGLENPDQLCERVYYSYDTEIKTMTINGFSKIDGYSLAPDFMKDDNPLKTIVKEMETIVIEDGVTGIARYAISGCGSLKSIIIPNSVTSIDTYAICDCSKLRSVSILNKDVELNPNTFYSCYNIASVNLSCAFKQDTVSFYWSTIGVGQDKVNKNLHTYLGDCYSTCELCGEEREAPGNHDFSEQPYQTDDAGKHYQICALCTAESEHVECTPGEAVKEDIVAPTCAKTGSHNDVVYCTVCNQKLSETSVEDAATGKHSYKNAVTKATLTTNGKIEAKCSVCGDVSSTKIIYAAKTVKLSEAVFTYDGKTKKPEVIIKDSKGKALAKSNYEISYPKESKAVGKYTVKVTLKGDYKGSKSLSFVINPPKTSISKLTAKSKAFAVKWAKKTKEVTGYEIQYSTSSKFAKGNKTVNITPAKTASTTIKKLSGGKKYYVRIRTYKTVGKKKYYSDWSAKKSVTAKK